MRRAGRTFWITARDIGHSAARCGRLCLVAPLVLAACDNAAQGTSDSAQPALLPGLMQAPTTNADASPPAVPFDSATPRVVARARASWPHDTAAYTQGLIVLDGRLLESIGLEGRSELREVDLATGRALRRTALPPSVFGEGLAAAGGRLYQLTWRGGRGYVYDAARLALVDSVRYRGEGWGLAADSTRLFLSDGSSALRVVDPAGFRQVSTIPVTEKGRPVWMLNELELVHGELLANIYETNLIARIDPSTGHVLGWIDVGRLLTAAERAGVSERGGTANGIAYDSRRDRLLVTGKLWPRIFEIDLPRATAR